MLSRGLRPPCPIYDPTVDTIGRRPPTDSLHALHVLSCAFMRFHALSCAVAFQLVEAEMATKYGTGENSKKETIRLYGVTQQVHNAAGVTQR